MTFIAGFLTGLGVSLVILLIGMYFWWAAGEAEVENDRV